MSVADDDVIDMTRELARGKPSLGGKFLSPRNPLCSNCKSIPDQGEQSPYLFVVTLCGVLLRRQIHWSDDVSFHYHGPGPGHVPVPGLDLYPCHDLDPYHDHA